MIYGKGLIATSFRKYKKKYTVALENMKGGDLSLPTDKPSAVYIVHPETYKFAQKIFPLPLNSTESQNIRSIPPKFLKNFEEIFIKCLDEVRK